VSLSQRCLYNPNIQSNSQEISASFSICRTHQKKSGFSAGLSGLLIWFEIQD